MMVKYIKNYAKYTNYLINYFFNKDYYVKFFQTIQGASMVLSPVERVFTREYKPFYIHDNNTGKTWNTNYKPVKIEKPMVHIVPHWNWSGKEGLPIRVMSCTNCDEVELLLNGISLGRKVSNIYYSLLN